MACGDLKKWKLRPCELPLFQTMSCSADRCSSIKCRHGPGYGAMPSTVPPKSDAVDGDTKKRPGPDADNELLGVGWERLHITSGSATCFVMLRRPLPSDGCQPDRTGGYLSADVVAISGGGLQESGFERLSRLPPKLPIDFTGSAKCSVFLWKPFTSTVRFPLEYLVLCAKIKCRWLPPTTHVSVAGLPTPGSVQ
jgi:hypothetical protein